MGQYPDVSQTQTATTHTGLLLQVYKGQQVTGINVTNWEGKSISHASVFHKKAGKRSSVSMPIYTQACSVTYQHTYSQYQRRNIARLRTRKSGKARINTAYTRANPFCSLIQPVFLHFLFPCAACYHPPNSLISSHCSRLLSSHPKCLFSDQPSPLSSCPPAL